jgi:hypothetical protein
MQRRIWIVFAAFGLLVTLAASGFASTPEEDDLLKTREAVWRAWFANDQKTLEQLVPRETIAISSGEDGWQNQPEILQSAADFQAKGGRLLRLEFPRTEFRHYGDVAVLYSRYLYETEMNGKRSVKTGRATEVFVRRNGKWTNPGWQTGSDK